MCFFIQKVDNVYCVMKKYFTGSGWKSHFGGSMLVQDKLTDEYKLWVDECSKLFGGLDMNLFFFFLFELEYISISYINFNE